MWKLLLQAWRKGPACQFEFASRYTRLFPDHAEGWMVLADGLAGTARYREARVALQKAGRFTSRDRRWYLAVQWGHLYREKQDEQRAEHWYRKAVALAFAHRKTGALRRSKNESSASDRTRAQS
jgi:tetratricopeptide (TPR) repeat protein